MLLYGNMLSPYVVRAALTARAKGVDIPVQMPADGIYTDEYRSFNPLCKIPTLVDDDFALPESAVIVDYLERVLPGPSLLPDNPQLSARAQLISRIVDLYIGPYLEGILFARKRPEAVAPALEKIGDALNSIVRYQSARAEHLVGGRFSVADATLIPFCFMFDAFGKLNSIPSAELIGCRPVLAAWWQAAQQGTLGGWAVSKQRAALDAFLVHL